MLLRGRLSGVRSITMPSGDEVVTFRVIIDRPAHRRGPGGRVRVDTIDCLIWSAPQRRRILTWEDGVLVEVVGSLQRRFWKTGAGGSLSRTEVCASRVRRVT
ncbi:MAG: single-stranded DNA-binding protein [Candidatus Nanopelagicales bacterium]|nr:single-stranded DNA-binding protein [Candidatus Nanopelagicales bacterium]MDP4715425.1 single-stranded DNA-binding protein [Candidatus Nanopelagicales bacterium]MDP4907361.1 single-stranded DNA-binding protein [Candidatus Nanopelagicales bacterium]MDP4974965.1 single-stranded DNA-binding protein [Candidatus Nanopelagicales bacterium]MDP5095755.1 single-stranded DNA-binding protein [Candidatus Nanopelagicales bacterium]